MRLSSEPPAAATMLATNIVMFDVCALGDSDDTRYSARKCMGSSDYYIGDDRGLGDAICPCGICGSAQQ